MKKDLHIPFGFELFAISVCFMGLGILAFTIMLNFPEVNSIISSSSEDFLGSILSYICFGFGFIFFIVSMIDLINSCYKFIRNPRLFTHCQECGRPFRETHSRTQRIFPQLLLVKCTSCGHENFRKTIF